MQWWPQFSCKSRENTRLFPLPFLHCDWPVMELPQLCPCQPLPRLLEAPTFSTVKVGTPSPMTHGTVVSVRNPLTSASRKNLCLKCSQLWPPPTPQCGGHRRSYSSVSSKRRAWAGKVSCGFLVQSLAFLWPILAAASNLVLNLIQFSTG